MSDYQHVKVVGIPGELVTRHEIRDVLRRKYFISLYIRAMTHFQERPKAEVTSWFEIGGIHGRPYRVWDNVPRIGEGYEGYCSHGSVLFPHWHRAWLLLVEQLLHDSAQAVVKDLSAKLPADDKFLIAIKEELPKIRMPYWDWAQVLPAGEKVVPDIFTSKQWTIEGPTGPEVVRNPLYSYHFGTIDPEEFPDEPFKYWVNTVRYPNPPRVNVNPNDEGNPEEIQRYFCHDERLSKVHTSKCSNINHRAYWLYAGLGGNFNNFSTTANGNKAYPEDQGRDSVEGLHNTGHMFMAGPGHMAATDFAAYDPFFHYLHIHVDRLMTLYLAKFPNARMEPQYDPDRNRIEDEKTSLAPFYGQDGVFLNTADIWDLGKFGSTYPELAGVPPQDREASADKAIRVLYGIDSPQARVLRDYRHLLKSDGTTTEYFVTQRSIQAALKVSYNVFMYLGDTSTPELKEANAIGVFSVFTTGSFTIGCEKCIISAERGALVFGSIPLTGALLDRISAGKGLKTLDPTEVKEYVDQNLTWEIVILGGPHVPVEKVPSLLVGVLAVPTVVGELETTPPGLPKYPPKALPVYGEYDVLITPRNLPTKPIGC